MSRALARPATGPAGGSGRSTPDQDKSPARAVAELAVAVGALVTVSVATGFTDVLIVVACLIVMVMVHELGHLLAAKHGGMKVTEYFLGFGPKLWSFRRGETEYGVKAFPLGGYVKIPGMTGLEVVAPEDEPRTYREQPFHARLLVAVAGSAMHVLMAFALLWSLLAFVGVADTHQIQIQAVNPVGGVPGPAQTAGLQPGDVVVSIDGHAIGGNIDALATAIRYHAGRPLTVGVDRQGRSLRLTVTPANGRAAHEAGINAPAGTAPFGVIGVALGSPTRTVPPVAALGHSIIDLGRFTWVSISGVGHLFSPAGIGQRFSQVTSAQAANQAAANGTRVESVVGAVLTAGQAVHAGIGDTLLILISINLFVGVFNLFPMLPLDGGHVLIAVYEKIRTGRRRVRYHADVNKLMPFTWLMVAFLGVLFATSLVTDLLHPMSNPFS